MLQRISIIDKILFYDNQGYVSLGYIVVNDISFNLDYLTYGIQYGCIVFFDREGDIICEIANNEIHKFRYVYNEIDYEIKFNEV